MERDWLDTCNENIGLNTNDDGFYYSHENVGQSQRFDTFGQCQDALDFDVVHEIVSRG